MTRHFEINIRVSVHLHEFEKRNRYEHEGIGRATSGAAWSMLGKAYMFQEKYQDAEVALKNALEQNEYALLTDYGAVFRKASGGYNNAVSIFDIKHKTNVSGGQEDIITLPKVLSVFCFSSHRIGSLVGLVIMFQLRIN